MVARLRRSFAVSSRRTWIGCFSLVNYCSDQYDCLGNDHRRLLLRFWLPRTDVNDVSFVRGTELNISMFLLFFTSLVLVLDILQIYKDGNGITYCQSRL